VKYINLLPLIFLVACSNYGLADKLANPGSSSTSTFKESFTNNYYVFVSSWTTLGAMNGSPYNSDCSSSVGDGKADCACTRAAAARGLRRSSTHVFRAWLSTAGTDAKCRVQSLPNGTCDPGAVGPWFNLNGQTVVSSYSGFSAGTTIAANIRYDEFGIDQGPTQVWTGTNASGVNVASSNCSDWTDQSTASGQYGDRTTNAAAWTTTGSSNCGTGNFRIYCVAAP
jgi:hypothetical protein